MTLKFDRAIEELALKLDKPIYAVGGRVRNFLISDNADTDVDLAGSYTVEELSAALLPCGFKVVATYPRTGTAVFIKNGVKYEYTTFRTESYNAGGKHTPSEIKYTDDIVADAKRRDFTCNAVYYDVKNKKIIDPLSRGVSDIKNKVIDTVVSADKVFSSDGLRLMRLARFSGELAFSPKESVLLSAEKNAENISDISGERIYAELKSILYADKKYPFSGQNGHIAALKVLNGIGVIKILFGIEKGDFNKIAESIISDGIDRVSAFLYGVIVCSSDSRFALQNVIKRLKPDKKTVEKIKRFLSYDEFMATPRKKSETKFFIAVNREELKEYSAIKKAQNKAKIHKKGTLKAGKISDFISKMERKAVPFSFADLKIGVKDITDCGVKGKDISAIQDRLLFFAVNHPKKNKKYILQKLLTVYTRKSY